MEKKVVKTDEEWKKELTADQYNVCRMKGTERPFTGEYYQTKTPGVYTCSCCGAELFDSNTKYDSGSGWPSFYQPTDKDKGAGRHRPQPWHDTHRSDVQELRRTPGPCVSRWPQAYGPEVLH
jgi:peptide-methionine (R)-S-oxide reductase